MFMIPYTLLFLGTHSVICSSTEVQEISGRITVRKGIKLSATHKLRYSQSKSKLYSTVVTELEFSQRFLLFRTPMLTLSAIDRNATNRFTFGL
jgi:hypothetical protein